MSRKDEEQLQARLKCLSEYMDGLPSLTLSELEDELDELDDQIAELDYRRGEWFDAKSKFGPTATTNILGISVTAFTVSLGWFATSSQVTPELSTQTVKVIATMVALALVLALVGWAVAARYVEALTGAIEHLKTKRRAVRREGRARLAARETLADGGAARLEPVTVRARSWLSRQIGHHPQQVIAKTMIASAAPPSANTAPIAGMPDDI